MGRSGAAALRGAAGRGRLEGSGLLAGWGPAAPSEQPEHHRLTPRAPPAGDRTEVPEVPLSEVSRLRCLLQPLRSHPGEEQTARFPEQETPTVSRAFRGRRAPR